MTSHKGRSGGSRPAGVIAAFVLVGALVAGLGIYYAAVRVSSSSADPQAGCPTVDTVQMAVDPAVEHVVAQALARIRRPCVTVQETAQESLSSAFAYSQGAEPPDVWVPASTLWLRKAFVGRPHRFRVVDPAVASTPVLLVGGSRATRYPTWGAAETSGQVSTPDPQTTTEGALALAAPLAEATEVGQTTDQTREVLVPFAQQYGDRVSRGLQAASLASLDAGTRLVQVATEQDLLRASSSSGLRALTPMSGAPVESFPVAVARGRSEAARRTARELAAYLGSDQGLALLHAAGLRGGDLRPIPGTGAGPIIPLPDPPPRALASRLLSWRTLSVPSSILAVIDASGSMDFDAGGRTRMELLTEAAGLALDFLPDHARVGLWTFSVHQGGRHQDWRVLEPTQRLDRRQHGRTQRAALRSRARQLVRLTGGGTGLYDTALAAYRQAQRDYDDNYSNAVVLMTDGANDDPGSISLPALIARLKALQDPVRPVRIIAIGISADADLAALDRIAAATDGKAYLARDPADIGTVFVQAVLSR